MFLYHTKAFSQSKYTKAITFWSDDVSLLRYSDTSLMTNNYIMNSFIIKYNFLKYDTINTHRALSNFPKYLFFIRLDTMTNSDSVISSLSNLNVKYLNITDEKLSVASCSTTYYDTEIITSRGDNISQNDKNSKIPILSIIPNPNRGTFSINYKSKSDFTIGVINALGIVVFRANVQPNTEISLPDHIASGIYYVQIESNNTTSYTQKISIIK